MRPRRRTPRGLVVVVVGGIDKLTSGTLNKSILSTSIGHGNLINGRHAWCYRRDRESERERRVREIIYCLYTIGLSRCLCVRRKTCYNNNNNKTLQGLLLYNT